MVKSNIKPTIKSNMKSTIKSTMKSTIKSSTMKASSLDNVLRQYRTEQAYIRAVPPSSVFSNALLRRIVLSKPSTLSALSKLNGIGQTRRLHYGKDIVRLVNLQAKKNNYNKNNNCNIQRSIAVKSTHHSRTNGKGARNTTMNAVKGKPLTKSRKAKAVCSKASCENIPIPMKSPPLNPVGTPIPTIASEDKNHKIVLSRFFPLPEACSDAIKSARKPHTLRQIKSAKTSVYVMELEDGRVYVGSSKDVPRRLAQHSSGYGSAYTKTYKPTGVLLPRLGNVEGDGDAAERDETLRYMMQRGIPYVRGWKFARVDMPAEEYEEAEANIRELFDLCRRCGYKGHFCTQCRASFDRMGNPLV